MACTLVDLNNFDLVSITGEQSRQFLQGQLTCNMEKASEELSLVGAYCDVTGRVITDFRLLVVGTSFMMLCSQGMGSSLKKALEKYIVFSKAEASMTTDLYERYGAYGSDAGKVLNDLLGCSPTQDNKVTQTSDVIIYRLAGNSTRFEILVPTVAMNLIQALQDAGVTDDLEEWELADIRDGVVHINPSIQSTYTPQLLNYDLNGRIDFKKGCYTGQEIIARMHYRGTAKKRLFRGCVKGLPVSVDSSVTLEGDTIGEVLSVARTESGDYEMLVILPCEAVQKGNLMEVSNPAALSGGLRQQSAALQILPLENLNDVERRDVQRPSPGSQGEAEVLP